MNHPSTDVMGMLVNGDLTPDEAKAVEDHTALCPKCHALLSDFRSLAQSIRNQVAALPTTTVKCPDSPTPIRGLLPALVASVLLITFLGSLYSPSITSALAHVFPFLQVTELSPQEVSDEAKARSNPQVLGYCDTYSDLTEAELTSGRRMVEPKYVPAGFEPWSYTSCPGDIFTTYKGTYGNTFTIGQQSGAGYIKAPEGASKAVSVGGRPALLVRGNWVTTPQGEASWDANISITLFFEADGRYMRISQPSSFLGYLEDTELIKIAESVSR